ncbi:hypothetical protein [Deinococcus ruber]|uniref:Uncharacterized protein n=1 Tax=Deinococcus ruber TaxID=1848197 RepID=A0A918C921_9DEIO|nr:hypothetical protein [Deinococcus ruber]GGR10830.1 hypothetical protein GCM10008957_24470 [Deinococcus ruber]
MTTHIKTFPEKSIAVADVIEDQIDAMVEAQTQVMFEEWSTRLLASLTLNVQRTPWTTGFLFRGEPVNPLHLERQRAALFGRVDSVP